MAGSWGRRSRHESLWKRGGGTDGLQKRATRTSGQPGSGGDVIYRRAPRSLNAALASLADDLAPETLLADVQRAWPQAVGAAIAAQARPTSERAGVLTISCSASVWAQELDLMSPQIIERLNRALPAGAVSRLRCVAVGR
jgi:predicted nucleic acid-binding Zn ribbon protein